MATSSIKITILEHTLLRVRQITITLADRQDLVDERHDDVDIRLVLVQGPDGLDDVGKHLKQLTFAGQRVDHGSNAAQRQVMRQVAEKDDDTCRWIAASGESRLNLRKSAVDG